jgi:hypothetical protein
MVGTVTTKEMVVSATTLENGSFIGNTRMVVSLTTLEMVGLLTTL